MCMLYIFLVSFVGLRGCHCPLYLVNGMCYRPRSSLLLIRMGFLWHVINTSSSLYIVKYFFVKIDTLPSSAFLPTIIRDAGNSSNVSDFAVMAVW